MNFRWHTPSDISLYSPNTMATVIFNHSSSSTNSLHQQNLAKEQLNARRRMSIHRKKQLDIAKIQDSFSCAMPEPLLTAKSTSLHALSEPDSDLRLCTN
ncbi:hypothetical protein Dsin_003482 [Dipteronia sinensis]|uniref:Uncharacterized protein n=1 Tax=Dipteronia sinensis TaxID=43782 RepID=A0AAE0B864_9ROSI|nr:hypothetical protein Dsin_003482 [Dipteronia sinensis]